MRIDYALNGLGVIERFDILYGNNKELHLEGRIYGNGEECLPDVNHFYGDIFYPGKREVRIDKLGNRVGNVYRALKEGFPTLAQAESAMRTVCKSLGLEISDVVLETEGVIQ